MHDGIVDMFNFLRKKFTQQSYYAYSSNNDKSVKNNLKAYMVR